jgi:hypothetical protein
MSTSKSDEGLYIIFVFAAVFVFFYYCNRWYENSKHHEGQIMEKCWLARDVRSAPNDDRTIYLDGEEFRYQKSIIHGDGMLSTQKNPYRESNAFELVYLGSDGDAISRYEWSTSYTKTKEKLGMKVLGIKFYLPCEYSQNKAVDNW